jgi:hypothetical protein
MVEQMDGGVRISTVDGQDIETPLSYEDIKELLNL